MRLVLASGSARRRELMTKCGYEFDTVVSNADEHIEASSPIELVERLALIKAKEVSLRLGGGAVVVGSDTIVVLDGKVIGKPKDRDDAIRILAEESGRTHTVYTGIAVITDDSAAVDCATADVTFAKITMPEIEAYAATGEPMDKAGAYGIQGQFAMFVTNINGSYFTIMGLPIHLLYPMLKAVGIRPRGF